MEAKKVKAEIVKPQNKFSVKFQKWKKRAKIGLALILDGIDLLIGWIPIVNTIWDFVTFSFLWLILKNKKLAYFSLIELPLLGLPPFSFVDMLLPVATIVTLIDQFDSKSIVVFKDFKRIK